MSIVAVKIKYVFFISIFVAFMVSEACAELVKVEVRKGDTLHGFSEKYLKDPAQWPKIHELNRANIKDPDKIFPGQVIRIPVEMLKDKIGDIFYIQNTVNVKKREGGVWRPGVEKERLFPEDGILTKDESYARVQFLVGSHLEVFENSLIYLKPTREKTAVASLLEGALAVKQAKVITPSAEVIPRINSEYNIDVDTNKTTKVSVKQGEVDVKAQGKMVTVLKGYRTLVEFDKVPQEPVALPLNGEDAIEYSSQIAQMEGMSFSLQVSGSKTFIKLVKDEITDDLSMEYVKKDLKPGQYFWRAAIIDKYGFRGEYSLPRGFVIRLFADTVVSLTGFEYVNQQEGIMRIRGIARNAERVVINGYPASVDTDGRFKTTIVLTQGQKTITVTAISPDGVVIRKYHRTDAGEWLPVQ
ncbi:LysM peptidoglycan-binding domain-containing protein [Elusimicrobiota bacterium]